MHSHEEGRLLSSRGDKRAAAALSIRPMHRKRERERERERGRERESRNIYLISIRPDVLSRVSSLRRRPPEMLFLATAIVVVATFIALPLPLIDK